MAIMNSTQFKSVVSPLLNEPVDDIYEQRINEYLQVFDKSEGTPRRWHEEPIFSGFPIAPELSEGNPVTYAAGSELYNARYIYINYGLAFALTQIMIEDGEALNFGTYFAKQLAQSMVETEELVPANILNRAFNNAYIMPGGDGVSLINSAHPGAIGGVGTLSNLLSTAANLSQTSLEQMLIEISTLTDWTGRKVRFEPKNLVVAPQNELNAHVLLNSKLRAGTANNDINPVSSMGLLPKGVAKVTRLTSSTAWYIAMSNVSNGLQVKTRGGMKKSMEGDFETDSMRYKVTSRFAAGWTDWHDIYGTPGV